MSITPVFSDLKLKIAQQYEFGTQVRALLDEAIGGVESGLSRLATYGFFFDLAPAQPPEPQEWPKMAYHASGRQEVVESEEHMHSLGDGWDYKWQEPNPEAGVPLARAKDPDPEPVQPVKPAPSSDLHVQGPLPAEHVDHLGGEPGEPHEHDLEHPL